MVEPYGFSKDSLWFPYPGGIRVARWLRRMSVHPEDSRVFVQPLFRPLGLVGSVVLFPFWSGGLSVILGGDSERFFAGVGLICVVGFMNWMLLHGLFRRFGVDREKVWSRWGRFFYREVRFDEVDRFDVDVNQYKLFVGRKCFRVDYHRFDYSLVGIRLLEELQYRRFPLQGVGVDDPGWEDEAQHHRNMFAAQVYEDQERFYDEHPVEFARLKALVQPPARYVN